jgi:hypothetical protein
LDGKGASLLLVVLTMSTRSCRLLRESTASPSSNHSGFGSSCSDGLFPQSKQQQQHHHHHHYRHHRRRQH